jgi:hypothetical protein
MTRLTINILLILGHVLTLTPAAYAAEKDDSAAMRRIIAQKIIELHPVPKTPS